MDADRPAMIGALVQQNLLRLQQSEIGMPLNQLKPPADPTPECTERRAISARGTVNQRSLPLATVKRKLKQRLFQWCTAKATPVLSIISSFCTR